MFLREELKLTFELKQTFRASLIQIFQILEQAIVWIFSCIRPLHGLLKGHFGYFPQQFLFINNDLFNSLKNLVSQQSVFLCKYIRNVHCKGDGEYPELTKKREANTYLQLEFEKG